MGEKYLAFDEDTNKYHLSGLNGFSKPSCCHSAILRPRQSISPCGKYGERGLPNKENVREGGIPLGNAGGSVEYKGNVLWGAMTKKLLVGAVGDAPPHSPLFPHVSPMSPGRNVGGRRISQGEMLWDGGNTFWSCWGYVWARRGMLGAR